MSSRVRGINTDNLYSPLDSPAKIRNWGVKWARLGLTGLTFRVDVDTMNVLDIEKAYNEWIASQIALVNEISKRCWPDIKLLLSMGTPPGGYTPLPDSYYVMFKRPKLADLFVRAWADIARACIDTVKYPTMKGTIYAFDLLNEPSLPEPALRRVDYPNLMVQTVTKINNIYPNQRCVVESPDGSVDKLTAIEQLVPRLAAFNVQYSFHTYAPKSFTFQGLSEWQTGVVKYPYSATNTYPNESQINRFDKAKLRTYTSRAEAFQKLVSKPLLVGEFSAVRWCPPTLVPPIQGSTYNYLRDSIKIFESNDWDWFYFADSTVSPEAAARRSIPFSLECNESYASGAITPPGKESPRLTLMKTAWAGKPLP